MPDFIESILNVFEEVFAPLVAAFQTPATLATFLANFGWEIDPAFVTLTSSSSDFTDIVDPFDDVLKLAGKLTTDIQNQDYTNVASDIAELIAGIEEVAAPSNLSSYLQPFDYAVFWENFPSQLYPYLLYTFLQNYAPAPFGILRFLGVLQTTSMPAEPGELGDPTTNPPTPPTPPTVAYTQYTVTWHNLFAAISKPQAILPAVYGWGSSSSEFNHSALLGAVSDLFGMLPIFRLFAGSPAVIQASSSLLGLFYDPASLPSDGIEMLSVAPQVFTSGQSPVMPNGKIALIVLPIPAQANGAPPATGIAIFPLVTGNLGTSFNITDDVIVTLNGDFQAIPLIAEIQPGPNVTVSQNLGGANTVDVEARLDAKAPSASSPWMLFGTSDSSYLSFSQAHLRLAVNGPVDNLTYEIDAGFDNAQLVIQFGDADSFIGQVFGGQQQTFTFSASLTWSNTAGFGFNGQGNIQLTIPVHQTLFGTVTISNVYVSLAPVSGSAPGIAAPVSVSGSFTLGPLNVSVQQIGLEVDFADHHDDHAGSFGDVDVQLNFKPPNGLGLDIEATAVSGGGFVSFDTANQQYAGGLELTIEMLQLRAFGLLDTDPFSFVVIIVADFPPIELGFGFALTGVGGLLGVNRTLAVDALRSAFRAHTIDSTLFISDPVSQGAQLVQNITSIFPAMPGHFVVAPMVQISWGDPVMITANLGVVISFPDPAALAIVGEVVAAVPDPDTPVILINLDVLGVIDFDQKTILIQASLYKSYVLAFSLSGDMAFLLNYGESPNFALSVGGFNPKYLNPPPGFPTLNPLTVSLGNGANPGISVQGYFAITSNSLQFGANANLTATASGYGVVGSLSCDVLLVLKPFGFEFDLAVSLAVLANGKPILSIHLSGSLNGPNPWNVQGNASFSILFFSVSVSVNATFGQPLQQATPTTAVLGPVQTALTDARNWQTQLPPDAGRVATLAAVGPSSDLVVVHPIGQLAVQQDVVPLNITIDKFNGAPPSDYGQFTVTGAIGALGGAGTPPPTLTGNFADGQFFNLTDAQQLSEPAYTGHCAGATLSPGGLQAMTDPAGSQPFPPPVVWVSYTTVTEYDPTQQPSNPTQPDYSPTEAAMLAMARFGASALSPRRNSGAQKYITPGLTSTVTVTPSLYVVADTTSMTVQQAIPGCPPTGAGYRDVAVSLAHYLAANPDDAGKFQIVPLCEVPAPAGATS